MPNEILVNRNIIDFEILDPRKVVVVPGRNTRYDLGNIDELAESIRINGMKEPCKVQMVGEEYQLINGHRRHSACMILVSKGIIPEFMATIVPADEDEASISADMLIANEGKPFLPLEEAAMLQRMRVEFKLSQKQIADKIGRSLAHVNNRLALLGADESIKEALMGGEIKTQEALAIVHKSHGDKGMQREIVERKRSGETGIVNKELLKGRFNKEQWDVVHGTFKGLEAFNVSVEKVQEILVSDNDDIQMAFIAGCFQNCADLAFTDIVDFYTKVQERVTSERENSTVKVRDAKDVRAEIGRVEEPVKPAKAAKKSKKVVKGEDE